MIRALIHHLDNPGPCLAEARRLLIPGGTLVIQDRTPEDCSLPAGPHHLRGYIMDCFPRLQPIERARRHEGKSVLRALRAAGFRGIRTETLWETRRTYADLEELERDFHHRTGRSVLHELSDGELRSLTGHIRRELSRHGLLTGIPDRDRWTVWTAAMPKPDFSPVMS